MAKFHKKPNKSAPTTNQQEEQKNNQIFSSTTNKIADSLKEFNALSDEERKKYNTSLSAETLNSLTPEEKIDLNNPAFLEQFWEFFKKNHPNLLGEIESKDKLTIYTQHLEDKGFSLENLTDKRYATLLHEEIREKDPEDVAINKSLKELEEYCDEEIKTQNMPASIFSDFAQEAGFETTPKISIKKSGKIKKINDLHNLRTDFLEKNSIKLREQQKKQAESILTPNYIPAERILITATIKKLKTNFKNQDLVDFEDQFKLPITIHSPIKNLRVLATEFKSFLDSHNIDETTRKKIDKTII
ncbi:TPA: hypothetical protein DEP21_06070, partial [Patescibacteria group bacterium]|nr:hypothetical protein [Candidatus Gracilibacteria bacterium]